MTYAVACLSCMFCPCHPIRCDLLGCIDIAIGMHAAVTSFPCHHLIQSVILVNLANTGRTRPLNPPEAMYTTRMTNCSMCTRTAAWSTSAVVCVLFGMPCQLRAFLALGMEGVLVSAVLTKSLLHVFGTALICLSGGTSHFKIILTPCNLS